MEYLRAARQDSLLRLVSVNDWNQYLVVRGEYNALCQFIDFPDAVADQLEQAAHRVGEQDGGIAGEGAAGYNGR